MKTNELLKNAFPSKCEHAFFKTAHKKFIN